MLHENMFSHSYEMAHEHNITSTLSTGKKIKCNVEFEITLQEIRVQMKRNIFPTPIWQLQLIGAFVRYWNGFVNIQSINLPHNNCHVLNFHIHPHQNTLISLKYPSWKGIKSNKRLIEYLLMIWIDWIY